MLFNYRYTYRYAPDKRNTGQKQCHWFPDPEITIFQMRHRREEAREACQKNSNNMHFRGRLLLSSLALTSPLLE